MAQEVEIKLVCQDRDLLKRIFETPLLRPLVVEAPSTTVLKGSYIDTVALDLAENGFAFRIRLEGDRWKAAIKRGKSYHKGLYIRDEWEVEIPHPSLEVEIFKDPELIDTLETLIAGKRLIVLFEVLVERTGTLLRFQDGTQIEAVVDEGKIRCYGQEEAVLEMEIELKSGSRERLVWLGDALKENYSMREGTKSKYARGLSLFQKALEAGEIANFLVNVEGVSEG